MPFATPSAQPNAIVSAQEICLSAPQIRLATRGSALALWQANYVADLIRRAHPAAQVELVVLSTRPDRLFETPLADMGGDKGLFVKEIEQAVIDGRADAAVHSLKDVPVDQPGIGCADGSPEHFAGAALQLVAFPNRANPADGLISRTGADLTGLPAGAAVATSALRRQAQLLRARPDLRIQGVRGNVDTRLKKLEAGEFDAIIMAAAGLERLGLQDQITQYLPIDQFLPAPGQGILVVQAPADSPYGDIWRAIDSPTVRHQAETERLLSHHLGASCHSAAACYLDIVGNECRLQAAVFSHDGKSRLYTEAVFPAAATVAERETKIRAAAQDLLAQGAGRYL